MVGRFQSCLFIFSCNSLATGKAANSNRGAYIQVHGLNKFKTFSLRSQWIVAATFCAYSKWLHQKAYLKPLILYRITEGSRKTVISYSNGRVGINPVKIVCSILSVAASVAKRCIILFSVNCSCEGPEK